MFAKSKGVIFSLVTLVLSTVLTLVFAEYALRAAGYKPSRLVRQPVMGYGHINFRETDTLLPKYGLVADSLSATSFRTDPMRQLLSAAIVADDTTALDTFMWQNWMSPIGEYYQMLDNYTDVYHFRTTGPFSDFYKAIINTPFDKRTDFENAVVAYVQCPLSEQGYRSMSMRRTSTKTRVLLLGDSFTSGANAQNKTNSFADILITKGYEVYNTGVGGADPDDYMNVLKKFLPLYQPEVVVVNLYLGNDVQYYRQRYAPYQPHHYSTNAGWLEACPQGVNYINPQDVYDLAVESLYLPNTSWIYRICSRTCIGTLLAKVVCNSLNRSIKGPLTLQFDKKAQQQQTPQPSINYIVTEMDSLCQLHGSRLVVSVIPNYKGNNSSNLQYVKDFPGLLHNHPYYQPNHLISTDYGPDDPHFNERGHLKYATFLSSVLDSVTYQMHLQKIGH